MPYPQGPYVTVVGNTCDIMEYYSSKYPVLVESVFANELFLSSFIKSVRLC